MEFCFRVSLLNSLIQTLQYDTIYHEHLRYYSLTSLNYLPEKHGFKIFYSEKIPTHGGSMRYLHLDQRVQSITLSKKYFKK